MAGFKRSVRFRFQTIGDQVPPRGAAPMRIARRYPVLHQDLPHTHSSSRPTRKVSDTKIFWKTKEFGRYFKYHARSTSVGWVSGNQPTEPHGLAPQVKTSHKAISVCLVWSFFLDSCG